MIQYLGALTIGAAIPMFSLLHEQFALCLGRPLAALKAQAAGLAKVSASVGITLPTLDAQIDLAAKVSAALQAAIELQPPSLTANLDALARVQAELQATLDLISATLKLALDLAGLAAATGVHAFTYDGLAGQLGSDLGAAPGLTGLAADKDIYCVAFLTEADRQAPVAAMRAVFAVGLWLILAQTYRLSRTWIRLLRRFQAPE